MAEAAIFDVFLSYSRADAAAVARLAEALRRRGLGVFLDRDYLTAGQAWPELLERQLRACGAVVVCLGPQGSRMSLVGDDLEHVVVVPGGPLAPAA